MSQAPGNPSKGVKKLQKIEAEAGKRVMLERRKSFDEESQEDEVLETDASSFPLEDISGVGVFHMGKNSRRA